MRSADLIARSAVVGVAALALCGCVSTQTKNARTLLVNARTLDSESPVRVSAANPSVTVSGIQLVRAGGGLAVAVTVENTLHHPVSDLPISVGLRSHGRTTYLNGAANLPYFATHVAGIGASARALWVYTTSHVPTALAGASAFAVVGDAVKPASTRAASLPRLAVSAAGGAPRSALRVSVDNASGVPQYGLPVYAIATRNGRAVGAASGSIGQLDGGSSAALRLRLFGTTTGATVQLSAPPTIFN